MAPNLNKAVVNKTAYIYLQNKIFKAIEGKYALWILLVKENGCCLWWMSQHEDVFPWDILTSEILESVAEISFYMSPICTSDGWLSFLYK